MTRRTATSASKTTSPNPLTQIDTPLGVLVVETSGNDIVSSTWGKPAAPRRRAASSGKFSDAITRAVKAYFAGDMSALEGFSVSPSGTPFQQKVWRILQRIPAGTTISYQQLATRAGSPRAIRAAGQACGANPIGLIIPCHRVIAKSGSLGGFSGGLERKRWLLDHEASAGQARGKRSKR